MKTVATFILIFVFASTTFAEYGKLKCGEGECEGWQGSYESHNNEYRFLFENVSGKAAFNIKILVNTFDYFDEYLGRIEIKQEGPIFKRIPYYAKVHPKTSKITYDIFWSDRSGKPAESVPGAE